MAGAHSDDWCEPRAVYRPPRNPVLKEWQHGLHKTNACLAASAGRLEP